MCPDMLANDSIISNSFDREKQRMQSAHFETYGAHV